MAHGNKVLIQLYIHSKKYSSGDTVPVNPPDYNAVTSVYLAFLLPNRLLNQNDTVERTAYHVFAMNAVSGFHLPSVQYSGIKTASQFNMQVEETAEEEQEEETTTTTPTTTTATPTTTTSKPKGWVHKINII